MLSRLFRFERKPFSVTQRIEESRTKATSSIENSKHDGRGPSGEGKRRNEFAEWHVAWLAEWHNYAEFNIRSWMIQRNKLNWKERPFFANWRQSICKGSCCFNVADLTYDDNQKTTKAHCRPAFSAQPKRFFVYWRKDVFEGHALPSTLFFSEKDVCTINLTVSCYVYLYSKPCEKCFFMRLWVTWSWHNWYKNWIIG